MIDKHIPENLIEYLRLYDWIELSEEAKTELRPWLSEEEYKRLRSIYGGLQTWHEPALTLRPETREVIMTQFRQKRKHVSIPLWNIRIPAWQAAAAAIVLFVLGFAFKPVREIFIPQTQIVTLVDTIFVAQPAIARLTLDSSVSSATSEDKNKASGRKNQVKKSRQDSGSFLSNMVNDINILKLEDKSTLNHSGKTWEEDSLISRFGFVQL